MEATIEQILDANCGTFRYFGIRIVYAEVQVGETLENSWHNASDCDWVEVDTELDGTCCFSMAHADLVSLESAVGFASCYWPGTQQIALVAANSKGEGEVPEDGACLLRNPVVLAIWEQEL